MLSPEVVMALAAQCAPSVEASTLLALARAESGLDPYAIGVNGPKRGARPSPRNLDEAVAAASALLGAGHDIDLGLGQINGRNLGRLGLNLRTAFEPCQNLAAAAQVLQEGYARGAARHGDGQAALRVALSYYNTGGPTRGFANGYVARVLAAAGSAPPRPAARPAAEPDPPSPTPWDVFARTRVRTAFVTTIPRSLP